MGLPMKMSDIEYEITPEYVEYNRITVRNIHNQPVLYRIDVNHQFVKLLYIEPNSSKSFIRKGNITDFHIKKLK